jgi:hypothetical protein
LGWDGRAHGPVCVCVGVCVRGFLSVGACLCNPVPPHPHPLPPPQLNITQHNTPHHSVRLWNLNTGSVSASRGHSNTVTGVDSLALPDMESAKAAGKVCVCVCVRVCVYVCACVRVCACMTTHRSIYPHFPCTHRVHPPPHSLSPPPTHTSMPRASRCVVHAADGHHQQLRRAHRALEPRDLSRRPGPPPPR